MVGFSPQGRLCFSCYAMIMRCYFRGIPAAAKTGDIGLFRYQPFHDVVGFRIWKNLEDIVLQYLLVCTVCHTSFHQAVSLLRGAFSVLC